MTTPVNTPKLVYSMDDIPPTSEYVRIGSKAQLRQVCKGKTIDVSVPMYDYNVPLDITLKVALGYYDAAIAAEYSFCAIVYPHSVHVYADAYA